MYAEQILIEFKKSFQAAHIIFGRPTFVVSRFEKAKKEENLWTSIKIKQITVKEKFQKSGPSPDSALNFSCWHMNLNYMYFFLSTRRNGKKACKLEVLNSCKMLYILIELVFLAESLRLKGSSKAKCWHRPHRIPVTGNHQGEQVYV